MQFKDYYQVLGVERSATEEQIKKSFRRLARKFHPDISKAPDAAARMQELNEAHEVLRDPEKRAAYDQVGSGARNGEDFQPPPGWNSGFEFSGRPEPFGEGMDHSAFFEALFGAARRGAPGAHDASSARAPRARDHHAKIVVPLEDSFTGATRSLSLQSPEFDANGQLQLRQRHLQVSIPKGIRAGQQIRLAGQGAPGPRGEAAGDLYLEVEFEPHPRWRVDGRDLFLTLPVAPWEAALGAEVPVRTPGGWIEMKVPAESQTGRKLRLRGRGIPRPEAPNVQQAQTEAGDFYVVLDVVLPAADTEQARAAYRQMAKDLAFEPRAEWHEGTQAA
jgi:curved DNA-binding protein